MELQNHILFVRILNKRIKFKGWEGFDLLYSEEISWDVKVDKPSKFSIKISNAAEDVKLKIQNQRTKAS